MSQLVKKMCAIYGTKRAYLNPLHVFTCYLFKTTRHIHCLSEQIVKEAGWATGAVWTGVEKKLHLALTGI
jgi:hypothetical protein